MHYYKRHIGDYAKDTSHLSLLEHGVYAVLMDWQYASEKPLPAGNVAIYRICRAVTAAEKRAVDSILEEFYPEKNGQRWNNRTELEVFEFNTKSDKNADAANKRWQKERNANASDARSDGNANDMPRARASTRTTNHYPRTRNQEPAASGGGSYSERGRSQDVGADGRSLPRLCGASARQDHRRPDLAARWQAR
jgi:uncharacterized protein YdaU (DUF1376 family)